MNRERISKLQYDTIKAVIRTTRMSVSGDPLAQHKLSGQRISQLIKGSPFHTYDTASSIEAKDVMEKGVHVMKTFAHIHTLNSLNNQPISDKASITVKLE